MVTARGAAEARALSLAPPPRTLLGKVNSHLICVLCRGYYIDATTIVECLHTFCRSCIVKHLRVKSYCPVCEMMINSARPNIKLDKALQDIVYKLVPGLFQREMARRREFYAARPELAADATPEQRGEDTERVVFSPEDVISFSLEYADFADADAASSRSSESGSDAAPSEAPPTAARRYLRCPAVVNVSHLKKFLGLKFDVDSAHFFVDVLYKRVPLPDYYTLMDVAYIYNWKRTEPMRFFYQISDFAATRDRFGFVALGGAPGDGAPRPLAGPASDGARTPPLDDGSSCARSDGSECADDGVPPSGAEAPDAGAGARDSPDVEKSQFLNSFELTAKRSPGKGPESPAGEEPRAERLQKPERAPTAERRAPTAERQAPTERTPPVEKPPESAPPPVRTPAAESGPPPVARAEASPKKRRSLGEERLPDPKRRKTIDVAPKAVGHESVLETLLSRIAPGNRAPEGRTSERAEPSPRVAQANGAGRQPAVEEPPASQKSAKPSVRPIFPKKSPQKVPEPRPAPEAPPDPEKTEAPPPTARPPLGKPPPAKKRAPEPVERRAPERPAVRPKPPAERERPKEQRPRESKPAAEAPVGADGESAPKPAVGASDPERSSEADGDRPKPSAPRKGDGPNPLRSLFNINIPSSLSITLTDQKQDEPAGEGPEPKRRPSVAPPMASAERPPPAAAPAASPTEKNRLEIIKLPDAESGKADAQPSGGVRPPVSAAKSDDPPPKTPAKGPVPNLKPISEAKIAPFSKPQTFQQTFLQSLQQQKEKPKYSKTRLVLPKMGAPGSRGEESADVPRPAAGPPRPPCAPTVPSAPTIPPVPPIQKIGAFYKAPKLDSALDLTTPHAVQSQFGPLQTKALETMQSINILAKRQYNQRLMSPQSFSAEAFKLNAPATRAPAPVDSRPKAPVQGGPSDGPKRFSEYFQASSMKHARATGESAPQPGRPPTQQSPSSERSQTRSPSSSPKLVIACPSPKSQSPERRQFLSPRGREGDLSGPGSAGGDPSTSKDGPKPPRTVKMHQTNKASGPRGPGPNQGGQHKSNGPGVSAAGEMMQGLIAQNYLRQQLELQQHLGLLPPGAAKQWYNNPAARAHFENIVKNMSQNNQPPFGNNMNSKDK